MNDMMSDQYPFYFSIVDVPISGLSLFYYNYKCKMRIAIINIFEK